MTKTIWAITDQAQDCDKARASGPKRPEAATAQGVGRVGKTVALEYLEACADKRDFNQTRSVYLPKNTWFVALLPHGNPPLGHPRFGLRHCKFTIVKNAGG
jgi:hypothetical protein